MKNTFFILIKPISGIFLIVLICTSAQAQKADDVQAGSVWNSNVKVDGRLTEWTGPLKASNKSTGLTYTLANDDKNLYLVILSTDAANNNKIMLGGISFTVNTDDKKKVKDAYTISYPVITRGNPGQGGGAGGRGQGRQGQAGGQPGQITQHQRDSMQLVQHRTQLAAAKDIKVHGFKNITDSLISIFNIHGVKAFASFDENGIYICEFAIPLESMQISVDKPKEFSYNIKLNGIQLGSFGGGEGGRGAGAGSGGRGAGGGGAGGGGRGGGGAGGFGGSGNQGGDRQAMTSPTDFWGKYILTRQ